MARDVHITIDCADPVGPAAFWAEAFAYKVQDPADGF